jgi:hypothetical protein
MMVFMTFNGFFIASLVLGRAVGFLIFSAIRWGPPAKGRPACALQTDYQKPCC